MRGEMTVRLASNLFTQKPKGELQASTRWMGMTRPDKNDAIVPTELLEQSSVDGNNFQWRPRNRDAA
jgi:hypothetical protein